MDRRLKNLLEQYIIELTLSRSCSDGCWVDAVNKLYLTQCETIDDTVGFFDGIPKPPDITINGLMIDDGFRTYLEYIYAKQSKVDQINRWIELRFK